MNRGKGIAQIKLKYEGFSDAEMIDELGRLHLLAVKLERERNGAIYELCDRIYLKQKALERKR